jgi:hypothetical protein
MSAGMAIGLPKPEDMIMTDSVRFMFIFAGRRRSKDFPPAFLFTPCTNLNHATFSFLFLCEEPSTYRAFHIPCSGTGTIQDTAKITPTTSFMHFMLYLLIIFLSYNRITNSNA